MSLASILIILPLVVVLATLTYTIASRLGRVWVAYRVRMALLEKLENQPDLVESMQELKHLLDDTPGEAEVRPHTDLAITGVILAILGIVCVVVYGSLGSGRSAVGFYYGGVICVSIGFLLALIGVLIRILSKSAIGRGKEGPP